MMAGASKLRSIDGLALVTLACIMLWIFSVKRTLPPLRYLIAIYPADFPVYPRL